MRLTQRQYACIVVLMLVFFLIAGASHYVLDDLAEPSQTDLGLSSEGVQHGIWIANNVIARLTAIEIWAGALALGFLGWTLFETRRTADAAVRAVEAAEDSDRPNILCMVAEHERPGVGRLENMPWHSICFDIVNVGKSTGILRAVKGGGKRVKGVAEFTINSTDWFHEDVQFVHVITPTTDFERGGIGYDIRIPAEHVPYGTDPNTYFAWVVLEYESMNGRRWVCTCTFKCIGVDSGGVGFGQFSHREIRKT